MDKILTSHLTYPEKAVRKNIQGTVVVQFIVDKNGMLSDIQAISGPAQLQNAAVDIIKQREDMQKRISMMEEMEKGIDSELDQFK